MARRQRAIHVAHSLNLGGAERLAARLATTLSDEFDVVVACLDAAGLWAKEVRDAGVRVVELHRQPGIDLTVAHRLAGLARSEGARLFHAHQYSPYFYSALARAGAPRTKLLFHEHGRHYPEVESPRRIAANRHVFARVTDAVVAVSADVKERVVRYEGLPESLVRVIYNGTDAPPPATAEERAAIRRHLGIPDGSIVVGTVGRLDPVKNVPLAVESVATLGERFPTLKLLVIGDGAARGAIEAAADRHGIRDRLVMTGFRNDAANLVRAMDVFLLPSLTEGTSLALVGAMAAAVPCVASAVGGNPEVVEDGVTGLLVPSGDAGALTAAVAALLVDGARAGALGRAGREAYLARFTFDGMIAAFRDLYRELMD
jgi:glycosyltransferase involved in cell wall biosynthesis